MVLYSAMKVLAVFTSLMAPFSTIEARAGGPKVIERVLVAGSDCEDEELRPGCDAGYSLVVNKYKNDAVKGVLKDKILNFTEPNENGFYEGDVDCLYIFPYTFLEENEFKIAIASGTLTSPEGDIGKKFFTAAKIAANGAGYKANPGVFITASGKNCTNDTVKTFFTADDAPFLENSKGKFIIENSP